MTNFKSFSSVLVCIILLYSTTTFAQKENKKAEVLFEIIENKIGWPNNHMVFNIGIVGSSKMEASLLKLSKSSKIHNKVVNIKTVMSSAQFQKCQVIFVPESSNKFIPYILQAIKNRSILLVSEKEGLINSGTCLDLVVKDGEVEYEINLTKITQIGLKSASTLKSDAYKSL